MKTIYISLCILYLISSQPLFSQTTQYKVDTSTSLVTWVGTKPLGRHEGFFKLIDGNMTVKNGEVVGGSYIIDINSLTITDLAMDDEIKSLLAGHLMSPDFLK